MRWKIYFLVSGIFLKQLEFFLKQLEFFLVQFGCFPHAVLGKPSAVWNICPVWLEKLSRMYREEAYACSSPVV